MNENPLVFDNTLGIYKGAEETGQFDNNKTIIKSYRNIEPRINIAYNFENTSLKFSYNRLNQYIHLISNTSAPAPLDVWTPSGPYLKPQRLDQWAIGLKSKIREAV